MKKILSIICISMILLLGIGIVSAHESNLSETSQLIDSGVNCDKLTDEQLESVGEYYMEQMHPGEAHELMDKMMGGEGSESLKQMHIQMARVLYCNEDVYGMMGSGSMMGMMPSMVGGNMISGQNMMQTNMMQGIIGDSWYFGYWNFINVLYLILLIGVITLVFLWIIKLLRELSQKKR